MMLGEGSPPHPTVHVPPWTLFDESTAPIIFPHPVSGISANNGVGEYSPFLLGEALTALQRYLPSNVADADDPDSGESTRESDVPIDAYSCDEFRIYEFKVRRCARGRSHDWTECPYAHPGEKARRRDPRKFHYSGAACPDFRKGNCKRGDSCEYAHGVFECWLHPARYRTQPCKDGTNCRRRVCFFAHTPEQLRILPQNHQCHSPKSPPVSAAGFDSYDGSPLRSGGGSGAYFSIVSSPTSTLMSPPLSPPSDSPPLSPICSSFRRTVQSNEVLASLRQLQLSKAKSIPASWGLQFGGSPKVAPAMALFRSLPSTPRWVDDCCLEEEPMERVESGRDLRAKIFEKLSKENLETKEVETGTMPDVGWVSELVK